MQKVTTLLMFEGKAEEAMTLYTSLFEDSEVIQLNRYGPGEPGEEGSVSHAIFRIGVQELMCMDSNVKHDFSFTPSISLFVHCQTETEIDAVFEGFAREGKILMPLMAYPFSQKFAWVADHFGVSWQLNLVSAPQT